MRWMYGPALGALYAWLRPSLAPSARLHGLTLGCGVWMFERLVFPRLHVTPPPRTWSSAERWLLAVQTSLFGLVTEAVLAGWRNDGQGEGRSLPGPPGSGTGTGTLTPTLSRREREGGARPPVAAETTPSPS
jgi:hypothetical protein